MAMANESCLLLDAEPFDVEMTPEFQVGSEAAIQETWGGWPICSVCRLEMAC